MKYPKVSIIILNWNGWQDTIECLESLFQISYPNYEVIVVDNASKGDDVEKIKFYAQGKMPVYSKFFTYSEKNKPMKFFDYSKKELENESYNGGKNKLDSLKSNKKLFILKNDKNYGFAEGNNIAIRQVLKENKSKYVLLLNNDTVVDKSFLDELVNVAESDEQIGIVGSKIYYYDYKRRKDVIWFGGGKINFWLYPSYLHINEKKIDGKIREKSISKTEWISGACMFINIKLLKRTLNSNYYFGCEDLDICINTKKRGYKIFYVPSSKIWHKIGMSRKNLSLKDIRRLRTNFYFVYKNSKFWPIIFLLYPFEIVLRTFYNFIRKRISLKIRVQSN